MLCPYGQFFDIEIGDRNRNCKDGYIATPKWFSSVYHKDMLFDINCSGSIVPFVMCSGIARSGILIFLFAMLSNHFVPPKTYKIYKIYKNYKNSSNSLGLHQNTIAMGSMTICKRVVIRGNDSFRGNYEGWWRLGTSELQLHKVCTKSLLKKTVSCFRKKNYGNEPNQVTSKRFHLNHFKTALLLASLVSRASSWFLVKLDCFRQHHMIQNETSI